MTEQQAIKRIKDEIGWESSELNREAFEIGIKALEEIQQYRAIGGTPEMLAQIVNFLGNDEDSSIINDLELLNQYRILGTLEELKEAKEKQIAKKPQEQKYKLLVEEGWEYACPSCKCGVGINKKDTLDLTQHEPYCQECGQSLDWGNEDAE